MSTTNRSTIVKGNLRLTIEVQPGYTPEQVVTMLNDGEARLHGNQITMSMGPMCDGFAVAAKVVSQTDTSVDAPWVLENAG